MALLVFAITRVMLRVHTLGTSFSLVPSQPQTCGRTLVAATQVSQEDPDSPV